MSATVPRPESDEYSPYYAGYISRVPAGADPLAMLREQLAAVPALLSGVGESRAGYRYAPEKWSIKEVVGHLSDCERVFAYRILRIARADETPLPNFDENAYGRTGGFDRRALANLVEEWVSVRGATLSLTGSLDGEAWKRRVLANGKPISARALAYIIPGHVAHHLGVLAERYGVAAS